MHASWKVVESVSAGKHPGGENEDRLLLHAHQGELRMIALIDGASLGAGNYGTKSSGALAADRVAAALAAMGPGNEPRAAVAKVAAALAHLRDELRIPSGELLAPSAAAAVIDDQVLWRVGDIHIALRRTPGEWVVHAADKTVDRIISATRAALIRFRLAQGMSVDSLLAWDPGRPVIDPLLREQNAVANLDDETEPLAFGTLNGQPVPDRFIETFHIGDDIDEIVLASDGYLSAAPTLHDAEEELQASLLADPLRIGAHASTKGTPPGGASFDDRTYVRIGRAIARRKP